VFQWPADRRLRAPGLKNLVQSAKVLGVQGSLLRTSREGNDVLVELPSQAPDEVASVVALTLDGAPMVEPYVIQPDEKGVLHLGVESSEIETQFGQRAKKENFLGHVFLTKWTRADDVPVWRVSVPKAGRYKVELSYGAARGASGAEYTVSAGKAQLTGKTVNTGGEMVFRAVTAGELRLEAGEQRLQVKASTTGRPAMTLEWVRLVPLT